MIRFSVRFLATFLVLAASSCVWAAKADSTFNWNPVMDAIIQVESGGNPNARNGQFVGVLQIAPVLVRECNDILKSRGSSTRFTLNDRLSKEKSKEMFKVIMSRYNPECDIDKACRIWKAGIRYTIKGTQAFVNRVRSVMKKQAGK